MSFVTVNGKIAVSVPPTREAKFKHKNGFGEFEHRTQLLGLQVLFKSEKYNVGDTVWTHGDFASRAAAWTHEGQSFCWLSENEVYAVTRQAAPGVVAGVNGVGGYEGSTNTTDPFDLHYVTKT